MDFLNRELKKPPAPSGVETSLTDDRHWFTSVVSLGRFGSTSCLTHYWQETATDLRVEPLAIEEDGYRGLILSPRHQILSLFLLKGDRECYCIPVTFSATSMASQHHWVRSFKVVMMGKGTFIYLPYLSNHQLLFLYPPFPASLLGTDPEVWGSGVVQAQCLWGTVLFIWSGENHGLLQISLVSLGPRVSLGSLQNLQQTVKMKGAT